MSFEESTITFLHVVFVSAAEPTRVIFFYNWLFSNIVHKLPLNYQNQRHLLLSCHTQSPESPTDIQTSDAFPGCAPDLNALTPMYDKV